MSPSDHSSFVKGFSVNHRQERGGEDSLLVNIQSRVLASLSDLLTEFFHQMDDAFFDMIRDKAVLNAMLAEVAGKRCADSNIAEKAKTQKKIVRDCLDGANGRAKVEGWLPGWLAFPVRTCTENGTLATVDEWARVRSLFDGA